MFKSQHFFPHIEYQCFLYIMTDCVFFHIVIDIVIKSFSPQNVMLILMNRFTLACIHASLSVSNFLKIGKSKWIIDFSNCNDDPIRQIVSINFVIPFSTEYYHSARIYWYTEGTVVLIIFIGVLFWANCFRLYSVVIFHAVCFCFVSFCFVCFVCFVSLWVYNTLNIFRWVAGSAKSLFYTLHHQIKAFFPVALILNDKVNKFWPCLAEMSLVI